VITLGGEIARLDKEIVGTILNENRCFDDLLELCYMGSRFLGTSGELLAREHIVSKLEECGLRPRIETFRHLGWRRGAARLEVLEPVRRDLVTISLAGGPSTEPEGITGELLDIGNGTPAEFERARGRLGGRIVVSTSLAPVDECTPPRQCHRRTKYGRAVEHGARAFIFMNSQPGMLPQTGSLRQDREGEIPAVTVPCEEGLLLRRLLERGPVKVRLIVENESFPNESANIVADIPGGSDDGVVLAGGH
jgi:hypothetical protein